jgi:drug/metabolite transporter (DMT)-like permease
MLRLVTASLIWCFSFGLIGNTLADLPRASVAAARLLCAALVFAPFIKRVPLKTGASLCAIGMIQFGLMYLAYMHSFRYLESHQVLLFTVFTPIYVSLINDIQERSFNRRNLLGAALAAGGCAVILWHSASRIGSLAGFLLVQASGVCFALGQLLYRKSFAGEAPQSGGSGDRSVIAWLYAGGVLILLPIAAIECRSAMPAPTPVQLATILYLGVLASGIAFFLWNKGSRQVEAGTLAVMNNLKIPLGVLISLLVFSEKTDLAALLCGSVLVALAMIATHYHTRRA